MSAQSKLVGVQYMRAIASLMVLIGHVIEEAEHFLSVELGLGLIPWTRGVDIFFVISGFIIMISAQKYFDRPHGVRDFLQNRFARVIPLYWLFTTLMLAVLLLLPGGVKETQLDWGQVLSSYLFIPYERYDGRAAPILSLGWTLNFEIFFYALFSLALFSKRGFGPLLVVAGMTLWALIGAIVGFENTILRVWSNTLIIEFCFGVILGHIYLHHWQGLQSRNGFAIALLLLGAVLLSWMNTLDDLPRFVASGIPATIMVGGMVFFWRQRESKSWLSRIGLLLGDSSYALYLSHRFILRGLTLLIGGVFPATVLGGWGFVVLACTAAVVGGLIVFTFIETPMLRAVKPRRSLQKA